MARGFIPDGLRSGPKKIDDTLDKSLTQALGALRAPSGINPLTTEAHSYKEFA